VQLRSIYDVIWDFVKHPTSRPRIGAYRLALIDARGLARVADVAGRLRTGLPDVWAVSLASKIACFRGALAVRQEPCRVGRQDVAAAMVERIRLVAQNVRSASLPLLIQRLAARLYDEAPETERFSSVARGRQRSDGWLYGDSAEAHVRRTAARACRGGESDLDGEAEVDLFCRPVVPGADLRTWRVWHMLLHLAEHFESFRDSLWLPMTLPAEDARRAPLLHPYFEPEEARP
jgi:hypothetical protein